MPENIVQAEFFHFSGESPEAIWWESYERLREGGRIKTVIRFYDEDGWVTDCVRRHAKLATTSRRFRLWISKLPRTLLALRSRFTAGIDQMDRSIQRRSTVASEEVKRTVIDHLQKRVSAHLPIAVEQRNSTFRLADRNELHDLVVTARASRGLWVFIFAPNDLLADNNTSVVSMM